MKLQRFTQEHLTTEYFNWLNNPEVNKYLSVGQTPIARHELSVPTDANTYKFAVLEGSAYIGTATLHRIDWLNRHGEIGYLIGNAEYWGRGLATEVVGKLVELAFNKFNLNKVTAGVVEGNTASIRVLTKNGFRQYGTNPQDFWQDGVYLDTHLFVRLKG